MNNQFVKDSLLPDEKILATAKFHPIKHLLYTLPFALLFIIFYILDYNSVLSKPLLSTKVTDVVYCKSEGDVRTELRWDGYTNAITENGISLGNCNNRDEYDDLAKGKGYKVFFAHYESKQYVNITATIIFWLIAVVFVYISYRIIRWTNSKDEFVITNKRVIAKVGVIRRVSFELLIEQVESIEVHQGIIGRLLKYGTEMPCGVGASKVRIPFVVNPFEFRQHFYDLKKPQNN